MNSKRQWIALTAVGCLAVLAAGWFLLVSPQHSKAAKLHTKVVAAQSNTATLRTQLEMLKAKQKDLPAVQAELAKLQTRIPNNPSLPSLIRTLSDAADASGVQLDAVNPQAVVPIVNTTSSGTAAGTTAATSSATGTPTTTSASAGGTAARSASTATAGNLEALPLTVTVSGDYFQVEQFFSNVEALQRAFLVTGFTLAEDSNTLEGADGKEIKRSGMVSATLTGRVFLTGAATAAGGPGAAAAPKPATTPSK